MSTQEIALTYKWTAKPGKMDELRAIYKGGAQQSETSEPGISRMDLYEVQGSDALIIDVVFEDAAALGEHIGGVAAQHFPELMAIADPGPSFFRGDVPDDLVQAAESMNMGAIFTTHVVGFSRTPAEVA